jgi:HAE1 family hydrophobic/amphiphilic exporter-1
MDILRTSIEKPVAVLVGVILIVLFGWIGLQRMPYQLSPTVVEPDITVTTSWRGATPYEVEREIIEPQERTLKGIPGLKEMESESRNGRGSITLRFSVGTDVDDALLRVSNKMGEVRSYPDGTERPVITATGSATSPVIWMVIKALPGNERHVFTYQSFFDEEVRQHLERVEGVADLFMGGGTLRELHVILNPDRLAAYGITVPQFVAALDAENVNVSAGTMGLGRRNYRIRTTGEFKRPEDVEAVVLSSTGQRRVLVSDVARVEMGYAKRDATVIHNGSPGLVVGIKPEPGTNILEMTERTERVVDWLNETKLRPSGVEFHWVYDQRFYINSAIGLIKSNILVGGLLAVCVLLLFLRSIRSTLVVATAIPISIIGTFLFMYALGRNLNVVSLAGIAFAVGMLVDNAIVVIENIDRHRRMGKSAFRASYDGGLEVWGAVIASTLTTVAVFLPVVFVVEEAGQLFKDIAIAVVAAVSLSLVVSVTVIPMFASKLFALGTPGGSARRRGRFLDRVGGGLSDRIVALVRMAIRTVTSRIATVATLTVLAVVSVVALTPKMEYLPQGNRNMVLNIFVPPPGLSNQERQLIGEKFFQMAAPYIGVDEHEGLPGIRNMFFVGNEGFMISGAISTQWDRARELLPFFKNLIFSVPGMVGVSMQPGIFETRFGRGRTIDLDMSGYDLDALIRAAGTTFGALKGKMPDAQVRPVPSIELLYPEVNIVPDRDRLKANGMTTADLGLVLDVLMDGRDVGDYKAAGQKKVDLIVMAEGEGDGTPEQLYGSLVVTPGGRVVPVSSLASLERGYGLTEIRHLERDRSVTLQITPPETMPLEQAMETLESEILAPMRASGQLDGITVRMAGAADKLVETRRVLQWNFILAALIAYLLMAALFGNFVYPLIIMFTVPLAGAGGFVGLRVLNLFANQPMDIMTMLGFVILIGVVVNNAILIVHQSLNNVRSGGMEPEAAVLESVRTRLRPIYMSATTSVFGMLPLVVFPGAGSELYRGLGSVILGGIAVSTIFTVFVIPSLLMFVIRFEKKKEQQT